MNVIVTKTTCDRCRKVEEREGDHEHPPGLWSYISMRIYNKVSGWSNLDKYLCPSCTVNISATIKAVPK